MPGAPMTLTRKLKLPAGESFARERLDWYFEGWRLLSWVRTKPTWIEPTVFKDLSQHPLLASSLILLKSPDWTTTVALYPVSTSDFDRNLLVIDGHIHSNIRRIAGEVECDAWVVYIKAQGVQDEERVVRDAIQEARKVLHLQPLDYTKQPREATIWDSLGICTYESLGGFGPNSKRPTADLLLELVPSFPIKTFLIDDGWQDHTTTCQPGGDPRRRLNSFGTWSGFNGTIADVVSSIRASGVQEVGLWVTSQAYWFGIDPDSELRLRYDCLPFPHGRWGQPRGGVVCPLERDNEIMWLPHPDKAKQFWVDYLQHMKSWGIGFLKVDDQAGFDTITGPGAGRALNALWFAMLEAVVETWGSLDRVIMCMSHNDRMLNGPGGLDLERPSGKLIFRNSDDFNSKYPDAHGDFVKWNLYNSILTSELALVPDFDMFASAPEANLPTYHGLLRCLGPGPLLLSDTPDVETDQGILFRMVGTCRNGAIKAVKMDDPIKVLPNRWFWENLQGYNDGPALMGSTYSEPTQSAIIGAWNIRKAGGRGGRVIDKIDLQDVQAALGKCLKGHEQTLVFRTGLSGQHKQAHIIGFDWQGEIPVILEKKECESYIAAKAWDLHGTRVAVLGMLDKFAQLAGLEVNLFATTGELVVKCHYASKSLTFAVLGVQASRLDVSVDGISVTQRIQEDEVDGVSVYSMEIGAEEPSMGESWEIRIRVS